MKQSHLDEKKMSEIIEKLSKKRPVFHSEADFQFALAWEIQISLPNADIRLEKPIDGKEIDIIVHEDGCSYPIELKYKTKKFLLSDKGESFDLKDHGAQNLGCYDCAADICRLESLAPKLKEFERGYAIWLINDMSYLRQPGSEDAGYAEFSVHEGAKKSGTMKWGDNISKGTKEGREASLTLKGEYEIRWKDFSKLDESKAGSFKYALICVR